MIQRTLKSKKANYKYKIKENYHRIDKNMKDHCSILTREHGEKSDVGYFFKLE